MPIVGEIDVSGILTRLGDPNHGLRPAAPEGGAEGDGSVFQASYGIADVSTSMAMAVIPSIIWDVNGYYRSLDIESPYQPTRYQLRLAYQAKEGWDSEYLTYVLKQLLNPEIRTKYDKQPLGHQFRDKYVILEETKKLAKVAAEVSEERSTVVTVDDLIEEEKILRGPKPQLKSPVNSSYWQWGYFLLKSRKSDSTNLEIWQTMLVKAFAERGVVRTISVGYIGKTTKPYLVKRHQEHTIFFINEDTDPTTELAETAVSLHIAHI